MPGSCSFIASPIWSRDALHRVERVHRSLEDDRDVGPAHLAHAALGAAVDVHHAALVELSSIVPAARLQVGRQQVEHGQRGRRLAAARLAGQAERLAAAQLERHVVDDPHLAARLLSR